MSNKDLHERALELANQALRNVEFIDVVEVCEDLNDGECIQVHDIITQQLTAQPKLQVVRSVEELEALDEHAVLMQTYGDEDMIMAQWAWRGYYDMDHQGAFPLVVIATGDYMRAAREALERESQ